MKVFFGGPAGHRRLLAAACWLRALPAIAQPVVTLTATPTQAVAPATVYLEAQAYAPAWARPTQVRFLMNGTAIDTVWAPGPYSTYVTNLPAGNHSFQAEGWNADGPGYSSVVGVLVTSPNDAPVVALDAPQLNTEGAVNRPVSIRATAYDADGTTAAVHFYHGTTYIGYDGSAPFEISWTPTMAGTYAISAVAIDNWGATSSSTTSIDVIFADSFEESCTLNPDSDRLPDCYEVDFGTNPNVADTDFDGLIDGDEVLGTTGGLNLPALGVNPLRKDLLVEYDWTSDAQGCGAHSHLPPQIVFDQVRQIFAAAPVVNPNGSTGINLIQDYGQGGMFTGGNHVTITNGEVQGGIYDTEFVSVREANLAVNRRGYFHYGLLAHRYGSSFSTGVANFSSDFMVTVACRFVGVDLYTYVRNTILHELGHTLSLAHGGAFVDDFPAACNYKPNYNSVMNYRYQLTGVDNYCRGDFAAPPYPEDTASIGYSTGVRPPLDEASLRESAGVCGHLGAASPAINWNGMNGIEASPIASDVNGRLSTNPAVQETACGGSGLLSVLTDYNDWANMRLTRVVLGKSAGRDATAKMTQCQEMQ